MGVLWMGFDDDPEPPLPRWQLGADARLERLRTLKLIDAAILAAETGGEQVVADRFKQFRKVVKD